MKKIGTREEVINNLSKQTRGGLTKRFLKYNAEGKIISVRRRKQRGGVEATLPSTNTNENSGSETNESLDPVSQSTWRNFSKLRQSRIEHHNTGQMLYYGINSSTYYFNGTDITYDDYIKMIITVNNNTHIPNTIHYITKDGGIHNIEDVDIGEMLFLRDIIECNPSPLIKGHRMSLDNMINITTLNATFYTKTPDKCGNPDIADIIRKLQQVKGGNPSSHIHTGQRGGRFVMVGGRRRYLRK
jgi:hypothetical protein